MKKKIKDLMIEWMLEDTEAIPLHVWDPNDSQIVLYTGAAWDTSSFESFI